MKKILMILVMGILFLTMASAITFNNQQDMDTLTQQLETGVKITVDKEINVTEIGLGVGVAGGATCAVKNFNGSSTIYTTTRNGLTLTLGQTLSPGTLYSITCETGGTFNTNRTSSAVSFPVETGEINWVRGFDKGIGGDSNSTLIFNIWNITYISDELVVELDSPEDGFSTSNNNTGIDFNASITPFQSNITNATIFIWNSSGDIYNETTNIVTGDEINSTMWNITVGDFGQYHWNVLASGTNSSGDTLTFFADSNFTFSIEEFTVTGQTWDNSTYDTDNSTFILNITVQESAELFSASLNYDGTSYLGEITSLGSGDYMITRTIDIPEVSTETNKTFNWTITLDSGGGFNVEQIDSNNQTVLPSLFENTSTSGTINFTILNEDDLSDASAEFEGSFEWYLGGGTVIKNNSFDLESAHNFIFNSTPDDQIFYLSSEILIKNETINSTNKDRLFQFNKQQIFNETTQIELLIVNESRAREVIIEVKDEGLSPLQGIFVKAERFYPSLNEYKMVENRETDVFGQFRGSFIEDEVIYRFSFFDENNTLLKEEEPITISCRTVICVLPFVIEDDSDVFGRFSDIDGFDYSLTFNNNTNRFSYTWNDISGEFSSARLEVTRFSFNGSTTVCNVNSVSNPNTLNCDVGDSRNSYTAEVFRTDSSGNEIKVDSLSIKVGDLSSTFGLEGLMWSFILLMVMIGVGIWSPPVGIVLYLLGFVLLGFTGIVYIHPAILIAEIILGVLFIWAFKG